MLKTEKITNNELFSAFARRLSGFVDNKFSGNRSAFSKKLGVSPSVAKSWLDGDALPGGRWLAQMANLGINIQWLLTGEEPPAARAADSAELTRLREDLAQERKEHEALQALYAEVVKHRNDMREVMEGLYVEVQVLSKEIQALRLQSSASTLTSGEARLLSEIADALGVPAEKGLLGVLQRVRDNLASAGLLASPDAPDKGGKP